MSEKALVHVVAEAAAELLRAVNVRVEKSGQDELATAVDDLRALELACDRLALADRADPVVHDSHGAVANDAPLVVDGNDVIRVLDQNLRHDHRSRPCAARDKFQNSLDQG